LKPDKLKPIDDMLREKPGGDCPMLKRLFITVVLIVATTAAAARPTNRQLNINR
jgi:hypothetical protein